MSDDLTCKQARALRNKLHPMLSYLGRLKKRMDRRKLPHDVPLFNVVVDAADALHKLEELKATRVIRLRV